MFILCEAY